LFVILIRTLLFKDEPDLLISLGKQKFTEYLEPLKDYLSPKK
jgi:hypothetical protein